MQKIERSATRRIGIITKLYQLKKYSGLIRELLDYLKSGNIAVSLDPNFKHILKNRKFTERKEIVNKSDLVIVFGGDGTILKTVQLMKSPVPILGINTGGLGVLTQIKPSQTLEAVKSILQGKFKEDKRATLEIEINGSIVGFAMNEAEINQGPFTRIIKFIVNSKQICSDGLIIATPTGSTGHSCSAGGPILKSNSSKLIVTPISPLLFKAKPFIVPDSTILNIEIKRYHNIAKNLGLNIDGQIHVPITEKSRIQIKKGKRKIVFLRPF